MCDCGAKIKLWQSVAFKLLLPLLYSTNLTAQCQRERHLSNLTWVVNLLPICLVNNQGDKLPVLCKIILDKITVIRQNWSHIITLLVLRCEHNQYIIICLCQCLPSPCQWYVWWAAPTQQLPLLDNGPPACIGGCWPDCRHPSLGPASHPSYCRQYINRAHVFRMSLYMLIKVVVFCASDEENF